MNLLITTQKVDKDDDLLGFFHSWIAEFARHYKKVTVICLEKHAYDLPDNVRVLSLGKKEKVSGIRYQVSGRARYVWRFYKYIWKYRHQYDRVFVHMNPEYLLLGGLLWRSWGKGTGLWYTHKSVTLRLRLAEKLVNVIFTASQESFRLKSKKVKVVGHGITVGKFQNSNSKLQTNKDEFRIVTIGRISPIKDYETLINAVEILVRPWRSHQKKGANIRGFDRNDIGETLEVSPGGSLKVEIVGGAPMREQEEYLEKLKRMVEEKDLGEVIQFTGPVPNTKIVQHLQVADLFVHTSKTGSLDKVVLEAVAAGVPVASSNDSSRQLLDQYQDLLLFQEGNPQDLADKIKKIQAYTPEEIEPISQDLQRLVKEKHGLEKLIEKISEIINNEN